MIAGESGNPFAKLAFEHSQQCQSASPGGRVSLLDGTVEPGGSSDNPLGASGYDPGEIDDCAHPFGWYVVAARGRQ